MYKTGRWTELAETYSKHIPHIYSNDNNFLPWHRALLRHVEKDLRALSGSCDLTIPYFDWTMDAGAMHQSPVWRAGLFGGWSLVIRRGWIPILSYWNSIRVRDYWDFAQEGTISKLPWLRDMGYRRGLIMGIGSCFTQLKTWPSRHKPCTKL